MVNSDTDVVWHALDALARTDYIWRRNYHVYFEMTPEKRQIWWALAQQQNLPMYQTLKLKVIELRMNQ